MNGFTLAHGTLLTSGLSYHFSAVQVQQNLLGFIPLIIKSMSVFNTNFNLFASGLTGKVFTQTTLKMITEREFWELITIIPPLGKPVIPRISWLKAKLERGLNLWWGEM